MLADELYRAGDPELQSDPAMAKVWMSRYKSTRPRLCPVSTHETN
jgi:Maltose acetyltransferase